MDRAAGLASEPALPGPTRHYRLPAPRLVPLPGAGEGIGLKGKAEGWGCGGRALVEDKRSRALQDIPPFPPPSVAPGSGFPLTTRACSRNWPGVGGTGDSTQPRARVPSPLLGCAGSRLPGAPADRTRGPKPKASWRLGDPAAGRNKVPREGRGAAHPQPRAQGPHPEPQG